MVWEYGAAVSAVIVDDNTVALTLTPGDVSGEAVRAEVAPATTDFNVTNLVMTSPSGVKSDLTLKREPGSNTVAGGGTLPPQNKPRQLVLAVPEPAVQAGGQSKPWPRQRCGKDDRDSG